VNALGALEPEGQPPLRIGAKGGHLAAHLAQQAPQDPALAAQHAGAWTLVEQGKRIWEIVPAVLRIVS
jgi:hypothetical protein